MTCPPCPDEARCDRLGLCQHVAQVQLPGPEPRFEDEASGAATCWGCGGRGFVVTCMDDLCRNGDGCIHGDGEDVCPECKGDGEL